MSGRKQLLGTALLLALMGVTGFFLLRDQPISSLLGVLRQVNGGYVLLGLALMLVFVGCEAMQTRLILGRLGYHNPYRKCLGYSFVGFYVSSITPSATGGQPAQVYCMSRDGVQPAHGALNMLLIAVCYQVALLGYALTAWLALPGLRHALGKGMGVLVLYGGGVMSALTVGMLSFLFLPGLARRAAVGVLNLLGRMGLKGLRERGLPRLEKQMAEYAAGAACLKQNPGLFPALLGLSALQLTALFSVPFVVYRAFGLSSYGLAVFLGTQAVVTLAVSALPLPGAVGPAEGGFVTAFTPLFGAALATPAMLVSRGISFYAFLLVSGCVTLAVHLRGRAPFLRAPAVRDPAAAGKPSFARARSVVQ